MCLLVNVYLTGLAYLYLLQVTTFFFLCKKLVFDFVNVKIYFFEVAILESLSSSKFKEIIKTYEWKVDDKCPNIVQRLLSNSRNCYLTSIIAKLNVKTSFKIIRLRSSDSANACRRKPYFILFMTLREDCLNTKLFLVCIFLYPN